MGAAPTLPTFTFASHASLPEGHQVPVLAAHGNDSQRALEVVGIERHAGVGEEHFQSRPPLARSRYSASRQRRLAKYGSPKGTPVQYRSQVKPKYHRWTRDGMQRLSEHTALLASLTLAQ